MHGRKKHPSNDDKTIKILSAVGMLKKINEGVTVEELYREATRKFDTLVEFVGGIYSNSAILKTFGFETEELKKDSLVIFDRLISNKSFNPYITLCVSKDASLDEIKRRRKKLLQIFHPDKNKKSEANEAKTRRINEAYDKITNIYQNTNSSSNYREMVSEFNKMYQSTPINTKHLSSTNKRGGKYNFFNTVLFNRNIQSRANVGILIILFVLILISCTLTIYFLF